MSNSHDGEFACTNWDPGLYCEFSDHRLRPGLELLSRVRVSSPSVVYDLGCGTGHITQILAERWPSAVVFGVDNSKQMLSSASTEVGRVQWIEADLRNWRPQERPSLLFSNATLHWLEDHRLLFPSLVRLLGVGGCLAVQMPLSWVLPSHRLMRETLANGGANGRPFGTTELRHAVANNPVASTAEYYDLLAGCTETLDIWETEYLQVLDGEDPVLNWVKSTGLRPILASLNDEERETFLSEYKRRLRAEYPQRSDGKTLYPFRRLFIVANV